MAATPYLLTTPRLGLRSWLTEDLEPFVQMNADPAVMEFFPRVQTRAESTAMLTRIAAHFQEYGYGLFAVDRWDMGEFIGFVGLARPGFEAWFTPCVEIGWRLRREAWGCGFATEAAREVLRYGLEKVGLERIYSWTSVVNSRSERVMQKSGMLKAGEFDHPKIDVGHPLRRHVLYEARR